MSAVTTFARDKLFAVIGKGHRGLEANVILGIEQDAFGVHIPTVHVVSFLGGSVFLYIQYNDRRGSAALTTRHPSIHKS
jgi:hypothetical protein